MGPSDPYTSLGFNSDGLTYLGTGKGKRIVIYVRVICQHCVCQEFHMIDN